MAGKLANMLYEDKVVSVIQKLADVSRNTSLLQMGMAYFIQLN